MRRCSLAVLALLAFTLFPPRENAIAEPHAPNPDEISGAIDASNRFAFELFQAISDDPGNLLFSPLGVSDILGVIHSGARGGTRKEMARIFHFSEQREETQAYDVYSKLLCRIQERASRSDCRFLFRCRLRGPAQCRFHDAYLARIQERHGETFSLFVPAGDTHAAVARGPGAAQNAGEPFPDLLAGRSPDSRIFLSGAVDLRGGWALPFDAGETRRAPFYALERVSPRETRERAVFVPMMRRTGVFGYARREGVRVLEIPYREPTLSLIVLIPDGPEDLHRLQEDLGSRPDGRWWTGLEKTELSVSLPRFRLVDEPDLCRALRRMGFCSAFFENTADLSGMAAGERLCLGQVRHVCGMTWEENAGPAGDAERTKLLRFGERESPDGPPEVRVDRPFLLMVRDTESGGILVLGRVMNPAL